MQRPWAPPKPACFFKKARAKTFIQNRIEYAVLEGQECNAKKKNLKNNGSRAKPLWRFGGKAPKVLPLPPKPACFLKKASAKTFIQNRIEYAVLEGQECNAKKKNLKNNGSRAKPLWRFGGKAPKVLPLPPKPACFLKKASAKTFIQNRIEYAVLEGQECNAKKKNLKK